MSALRRDDRLRSLSDDHHQALVLARRAMTAGENGAPAERELAWAEVVRRFASELAPHFAIEEQLLLPAMEAAGQHDLAERTRAEHQALRDLLSAAAIPLETRLVAFGTALRDHVRFEERLLFTSAQEKASDEALEAVSVACRLARAGE